MSRKRTFAAPSAAAPTTAVPGTEAQTIIQDATQAAKPESTLGDGDATGAAQEATSATAAPEASAPDVVNAPEADVVTDPAPAAPETPPDWIAPSPYPGSVEWFQAQQNRGRR